MDVLDLGLLHCPKIEGIDGKDYFSNMTIELFDEFPGYFIEAALNCNFWSNNSFFA